MENSKNKQLSFQLLAILNSVVKFHTILLHLSWNVNHPFVR